MQRRNTPLWALGVLALADISLIAPVLRYGAAFVLLWVLPGCAWALLMRGRASRPTSADWAIGLGLGLASITFMTLLLHYLPGPLGTAPLLLAANALTIALLLLSTRARLQQAPPDPDPAQTERLPLFLGLLIVVLVAASFRLVNLGYSEFQGDEGVIMGRAARILAGDDAQLFYHHKGPAEILVPTATWVLSKTINEWQARLPLAFASILGIGGFYLLGQRLYNRRTALIAALLLGINGYFVGFGRIVQYQNLVLAGSVLGMLALWRWSRDEGDRWLFAGVALLAYAMLAHYDAIWVLPAAAYIVGRRLWIQRRNWRANLFHVSIAGLMAILALLAFYLPFYLNPSFANTMNYLTNARLSGGSLLYNNLAASLPLNTFYNSTYYLGGVVLFVAVALFLAFRGTSLFIPASGLALAALTLSVQKLTLATGPVLALVLAATILSRRISTASRTVWLWFGAPFAFYYFLVGNPITHVLNVFPAALLLAAWSLDHLLTLPTRKAVRALLSLTGVAVFIFLAYYPYLMFVQHQVELKRTWPVHHPTLYWRPYEERPYTGYFGFPYRAGWKAVGVLAQEGVITGAYGSNEEQEVTGLYVPELERSFCPGPDWYLIAKNVQDLIPTDPQEIESDYYLWGEVHVGDETKLWIYGRASRASDSVTTYDVRDYVRRYDSTATANRAVTTPRVDYIPTGYTLGDDIRLVGYWLDTHDARAGGSIHVTLYWEALRPVTTVYQVFNHLYDGSTMWGQKDSTPGCGLWPTPLWNPGQMVRDDYIIPISPEAPSGEIPILTGMYNLIGPMKRLPVYDSNGTLIGDAIPLAAVDIP